MPGESLGKFRTFILVWILFFLIVLVLIQNVGEVGKSNGRLVCEQVGTVFTGRSLASLFHLFHLFQKLLHFLAVFIKELFRFRRSFGVQL